jgi:hypothetical protein
MPLVGEVPPPPPRRAAKSTATAPKKLADIKPAEPSRKDARVATLKGYGEIAQACCLMFGLYADAETLELHSPPFLSAVADMGDHHEGFGASLDKADVLGPYMALAVAGIPMAMQLMANHGRIDATKVSFGGIVPPEQLAHRRQAKLMEAQAAMIRAQRMEKENAQRAEESLRQEIHAMQALNAEQVASV